ncbi:ABC transporter substrate-binding protein [Rubellimicrobium arenae]|uniref:ABC transporter substrate-binding protein n=1 Tax=Rubellimicrobium arenae TaxID=2817372 RepID=UPI001B312F88|nr:sugar ABC transporter substrate-binding protein [Rubellimicrobium arenae]
MNRRTALQLGAFAGLGSLIPRWALAQDGSVSYWHTFTSQTEVAGLDRVMALFAEARPGVTVTPEAIPNTEFMTKMTSAVMADARPDVVMVASERFTDMAAMGALVDITERVNGWERRGDYDDSRFAGITDAEGRIYGVPAFSFVDWMYYRKDWFDEAGIAPPTTLEEMRQAAIALTDPSKGRYGFGLRGGPGGQNYIVNVMEAFGAPVQVGDTLSIDRDQAVEAIRWYAGLLTQDGAVPASAPNDGFRQVIEGFQTGQTAMIWHHTGSFRDIASRLEPGVQFGTLAMPAGPAARVARLGYAYHAMSSEANADAAWSWINFWGEPDAGIAFLEETGYFPASTTVAQDPRISQDPLYAPAAETLGFGSVYPLFVGYPAWVENVVLPAFQEVLIGQTSPEGAVDQMVAGLEDASR